MITPNKIAGVVVDRAPEFIEMLEVGVGHRSGPARQFAKRSHVLKGGGRQPPDLSIVPSGRIQWGALPDTGVSG